MGESDAITRLYVLQDRLAPWALSLLHAALGAIGRVLLIYAALTTGISGAALAALVILVIAALDGAPQKPIGQSPTTEIIRPVKTAAAGASTWRRRRRYAGPWPPAKGAVCPSGMEAAGLDDREFW